MKIDYTKKIKIANKELNIFSVSNTKDIKIWFKTLYPNIDKKVHLEKREQYIDKYKNALKEYKKVSAANSDEFSNDVRLKLGNLSNMVEEFQRIALVHNIMLPKSEQIDI